MLAVPVTTHSKSQNGPRPINLVRDTRQVLKLLDITFGRMYGLQGRRVLYDRLSLRQVNPLALSLNIMTSGLIPGFVWEENGQIIGNLTILGSEVPYRYLIANVAVLPNFRRRGIARGLMNEALNYINGRGGRSVMLQVESDNEPAISLYRSLGFHSLGTVNRWQTSASRLRYIPVEADIIGHLRTLGRRDWQAAYNLDRLTVHPDLNWPIPPTPELYKTGIWRSFIDFLNGRRSTTWVSELQSKNDGKRNLIGLASINSEWGRPAWLRIRIDPAWQGKVEIPLINQAIRQLKRMRTSTIRMNHPADDEIISNIVSDASFKIKRSLNIMALDLTQERQ